MQNCRKMTFPKVGYICFSTTEKGMSKGNFPPDLGNIHINPHRKSLLFHKVIHTLWKNVYQTVGNDADPFPKKGPHPQKLFTKITS